MRLFWVLILALLVSAIGLQTLRQQTASSPRPGDGERIVINRVFDPVPARALPPEPVIEATSEPEPVHKPEPTPAAEASEIQLPVVPDAVDDIPEPVVSQRPEPIAERAEPTEPDDRAEPEPLPTQESAPEPTGEIVIDLAKLNAPPPDHTVNPDGSITLADGTVITGSGTEDNPFVLSWAVLRSVERTYQPRSGKDEFPGWIERIDGRPVRIEGNTLLPVVSDSSRELLVMQNPWDGCCIGVPPTPFDAIEVELLHDVDFGYETVGYGVVEGTFVVDPYVVDGWVLGVYLIKDASYKSDAGTVLPDL